MLQLNHEDKIKLENEDYSYFNVHHFDFSCGSFYVKFCNEEESFKELIGKKFLI